MRFVSVFIFLCDLCLKLAYMKVSKFASVQVLAFYQYIIIARILFIIGYHLVGSGLSIGMVTLRKTRLRRQKK